jgi:Mn2+/Fe2+ NRAMP family transporter
MAAGAALLTGWPPVVFVPVFAVFVVVVLVVASYMQMARFLKWATLTLFAYVFAAFAAHPHWPAVFRGTIAPHTAITGDYLLTFVAILGTTISPYLFFWQAAQEAEDEAHKPAESMASTLRNAFRDTAVGMGVSNVIMYFIILTTGATLHEARAGAYINTAEQAAAALRPLAGDAAALLFTLGIVGTGLLGVPVLAGSAAYAVSEAARWRGGMDEKVNTAPRFYGVIALATIVGAVLNYVRLDAMRMLFWSAVINGLLAPPLIIMLLVVTNDKRVMGRYRNGLGLNLWGGGAAAVMTIAAVALVWSWIH